jgi:hypothetical protein
VPQRDDARSNAPRGISITCGDDYRIARFPPAIDPLAELEEAVDTATGVHEMDVRFVEPAGAHQIRSRDVVNDALSATRPGCVAEPSNDSAVRAEKAGETEEQRRLPAPNAADDRERFARPDREIDITQHLRSRRTCSDADGELLGESPNLERDWHADG